ncbi:MAG: hypothetical protein AB7K24_34935, partial [Gemmataceae bacterium]
LPPLPGETELPSDLPPANETPAAANPEDPAEAEWLPKQTEDPATPDELLPAEAATSQERVEAPAPLTPEAPAALDRPLPNRMKKPVRAPIVDEPPPIPKEADIPPAPWNGNP